MSVEIKINTSSYCDARQIKLNIEYLNQKKYFMSWKYSFSIFQPNNKEKN